MGPERFRKKPVEVEAVRYTVESCHAIHEWADLGPHEPGAACDQGIAIETLEGTMFAVLGDWIIRGVAGEFYPVKPDIFEATYEPVSAGGGDTPDGAD